MTFCLRAVGFVGLAILVMLALALPFVGTRVLGSRLPTKGTLTFLAAEDPKPKVEYALGCPCLSGSLKLLRFGIRDGGALDLPGLAVCGLRSSTTFSRRLNSRLPSLRAVAAVVLAKAAKAASSSLREDNLSAGIDDGLDFVGLELTRWDGLSVVGSLRGGGTVNCSHPGKRT